MDIPNQDPQDSSDFFAQQPPLRVLALSVSLIALYQLGLALAARWETLDPRLVIVLVGTGVEIALPLGLIRTWGASWRATLRLSTPPPRQILWTMLLGMSLLLPVEFLGALNSQWISVPSWFTTAIDAIKPTTPVEWIYALLAIAVVAPLGEEILFRGLMQQAARQGIGGIRAALAIGALFALMHFEPWYLLPLIVLGIVFGLSFERSGSLWTPILLHATYNGTSVAVLGFGELQDVPVPLPMLGILATVSAGMAYVVFGRLRVVESWDDPSDAMVRSDDPD